MDIGDRRRRHALATLRHRDFALLWGGQLVSTVGDQIQVVAISWHIYVLTGSPLQLGLVGVVRAVPFLVLTLIGGAIADTVDRRKVLLATQGFQMAVSAWLVIETFAGTASELTLYAVTFLTGAAQAFDIPTRQALVTNVVPEDELAGAYNLNTLLRQVSMILGPGVGGVLIGQVGLGWSYAANGISFLLLMGSVLAMRPVPVAGGRRTTWDMVVGGLNYALRQPLVRGPLIVDFLTRSLGSSRGLLPIFAKDVFNAGPEGLGLLNSALSIGAVAGGLALGARGTIRRPVPVMLAGYAAEAIGLVCLGLAPAFGMAIVALFGMGIANVVGEVPRVTLVQLSTPNELRGRVSALAYMFTYGGPQFGQLDSGALAEAFGPNPAAVIGGLLALAAVAIFGAPLLRKTTPNTEPAVAT